MLKINSFFNITNKPFSLSISYREPTISVAILKLVISVDGELVEAEL
jgi:hypothetical protein